MSLLSQATKIHHNFLPFKGWVELLRMLVFPQKITAPSLIWNLESGENKGALPEILRKAATLKVPCRIHCRQIVQRLVAIEYMSALLWTALGVLDASELR